MILVSRCLLGENCRYDGKSKGSKAVMDYLDGKPFVACCPECDGGLSTPRLPSEIIGGDGFDVIDAAARVVMNDGSDVTEQYLSGAKKALELAKESGAELAILKANSPSCGNKSVYDGSFSGKLRAGAGVTAALLMKNGIEVISENEVTDRREDGRRY